MENSGDRVAAMRSFNRFYTRKAGWLQDGMLGSRFSLSEIRVLYELAHRKTTTAAELGRDLGIDPGYLSRILQRFAQRGLVSRRQSPTDGRETTLTLTPKGGEAFAPLNQRQNDEVAALLAEIPAPEADRAIAAMRTIEDVFMGQTTTEPYVLRTHQAGDIGWVVSRHGALYADEYGWDLTFEALVAEITAKFLRDFDPKRERCWIAERNGRNAGSVFIVNKGDGVAQLRLLLVEPDARGLGIGRRLVDECIRFAKQCRYKKMTLWTNDILHAARRIYQQAGFTLVEEEKHHSFGADLVGQNWELTLT
jgi:DNA-binding MarR family transcriptional regulator/ribosomal protein S18 acetylase RimI-like enzyme